MSEEPPNGLNLDQFKERQRVELNDRVVYIRALNLKRIRILEANAKNADDRDYGKEYLRLSCFDKQYEPGKDASDDDNVDAQFVDSLLVESKEADLKKVCAAVAETSRLTLGDGDPLEELGKAARDNFKKLFESMSQTMSKAFGSISDATKFTLGESMVKLGGITKQLQEMSARRFTPEIGAVFDRAKPSPLAASIQPTSGGSGLHIEPPKLPSIEDGPIGRAARATEATAETMGELAQLMAGMTEQLGIITSTITTQVLPTWQQSIEDGQVTTNKALQQADASIQRADTSIRWTQFAFYGSIITSIATCAALYFQADSFNKAGDAQQTKTMQMMQQQLDASLAIQRQLASDAAQLHAQLEANSKHNTLDGASTK